MTSNQFSVIEKAAESKIENGRINLPNSSKLVETLVSLEKSVKKKTSNYGLKNLVGCWNLRFITGTKKSRQKAGIALGAGRYIPKFITIQIVYEQDSTNANHGKVTNSVQFAFFQLSLSGPIKFISPKNILAFDFAKLKLEILGVKLYDNYVSNGEQREKDFYQNKLANQAFFSYFLIQENAIAARGKGGGLALWVKNSEDNKD